MELHYLSKLLLFEKETLSSIPLEIKFYFFTHINSYLTGGYHMNQCTQLHYKVALCYTKSMKKIFLLLVALSMLTPWLVFADSYEGPFCFEPKSMTVSSSSDPQLADPNGIRGTCKIIKIKDVISLDPSIQNSYFIGTHNSMKFNCDKIGCENITKYSEQLMLYSSSTITLDENELDHAPIEVAVFNKSFFLPLLLNQFRQKGLNFSGSDFPPILINVVKPEELNEIAQSGGSLTDESGHNMDMLLTKIDTLLTQDETGHVFSTPYSLNTLSYQEYGKYIWGPPMGVVESQYAGLYKNDYNNKVTASDLGISYVEVRQAVPTVSIINPLNSITNYWTYSQINGKIALSWQKTDYELDDGTVKTIMSHVNNNAETINAASSASSTVTVTATPSSQVAQTSAQTPAQTPPPVRKNILQKIWDFILSWFR